MDHEFEEALEHVNGNSRPSGLRITDMRFTDIRGAATHGTLVKLYTNQGIVGIGEIRDFGSRTYAALLKGRLLGENPCDVDRLFRRIKQFMGPARQGGGVAGIEIALWDLAGKAYGVPVYQMLGGRFRDRLRVYCDLGSDTRSIPYHDGRGMGKRLRRWVDEQGFTMVKAILGVEGVQARHPDEKLICAPEDQFHTFQHASGMHLDYLLNHRGEADLEMLRQRNAAYQMVNTDASQWMFRLTDRGLDRYEEEVCALREEVGEAPLALDHVGYLHVEDAAKLLKRLEKYHLAWAEDVLPCTWTEEYVRLRSMSSTALATGEDLTTLESFEPLIQSHAVPILHPDVCSSGILECKKIGDLAQRNHIAMAMHMCESPVAALATAHMAMATENVVAMEFNAPDCPWWKDIVLGHQEPIIRDGFISVSNRPGLGFDDLNDDVLREHLMPGFPTLWESTDEWNMEYSNDRLFS